MSARVLGLDAAWTATHPSGLALLVVEPGGVRLAGLARSYAEALTLGPGVAPDWSTPPELGADELPAVLTAWGPLDAAGVDMPLAHATITTRREADRALSRAYAARGAAVHSPTKERPGAVGRALHAALVEHGLTLATAEPLSAGARPFAEVYPHAAIVEWLGLSKRLPYKVDRRAHAFAHGDTARRWSWCATFLDVLRDALAERVVGVDAAVPSAQALLAATSRRKQAVMKGYEDALDAIVCGLVAVELLAGRTRAFGDAEAAIHVPADSGAG